MRAGAFVQSFDRTIAARELAFALNDKVMPTPPGEEIAKPLTDIKR